MCLCFSIALDLHVILVHCLIFLITALRNDQQSVILFCLLVLGRVCCALVVRAVVAASIFRHLSSYAFSGLVVK